MYDVPYALTGSASAANTCSLQARRETAGQWCLLATRLVSAQNSAASGSTLDGCYYKSKVSLWSVDVGRCGPSRLTSAVDAYAIIRLRLGLGALSVPKFDSTNRRSSNIHASSLLQLPYAKVPRQRPLQSLCHSSPELVVTCELRHRPLNTAWRGQRHGSSCRIRHGPDKGQGPQGPALSPRGSK